MHTAVASPERRLFEQQTSNLQERSRLGKILNKGLAVGAGIVALAGIAPESTRAAESDSTTVIDRLPATYEVRVGSSSMSAEAFASIRIVGNVRTVAAARIRKAERAGNCITVSGKKAAQMGVLTQGYNGTGVGYFGENRRSTLCDLDGDGGYDVRKECGNRVKVRPRSKPKPVIWVKNFNKASAEITVKAASYARAECKSTDGTVSAAATGSGVGKAKGRIRIRTAVKAKGALERVKTNVRITAEMEADAKAKAEARVECAWRPAQPQPPEQPPTQPPTQPPPAQNQPPTGESNPSRHRYVNSVAKECVDNIRDPENDPVEARDFRFVNSSSTQVGGIESGVFYPTPGVACVMWNAGPTAQDGVWMHAILDDGKGNAPQVTSRYSFPVLERPTTP